MLLIHSKHHSGTRDQYKQGSHWRMRRKETEVKSIKYLAEWGLSEQRGERWKVPLISIAMKPPQTPAEAQSGYLSNAPNCFHLLNCSRDACLNLSNEKLHRDTTLPINLDTLSGDFYSSSTWTPKHYQNYTTEIKINRLGKKFWRFWLLDTQKVVVGPTEWASREH